jgi:hypothetical protein
VAHSACDSAVVLANLVPGGCRGGSCAYPGAASRAVAQEFLFDRHPYTSSRVWLMGGRKLHSVRRGDVPSAWVTTTLGMILQYPGWQHSGGDGSTAAGMAAQGWR